MADRPYLVTARKHRPNLFREVVAQEHITETLKNALRLDRLAHAYLFSGPRGVGKTTVARILAKAINCETPPEKRDDPSEPCRTCRSCRDFEEGRSLSIFEIDAASNNKVEDIRELRETVRFPPQGAKKKVYIVDEVHMLSNAAFNALLKTLEEPPPYVLFIFATTEPHKVIPTILSRCQRFDFRRIPVPAIVRHLEYICAEEDVTSDADSLILLARKGDGALRDSLSAFDQAVALCGTELRYANLAEALRVVDIDLFFEVTGHVTGRSVAGMLSLVETVVRSGFDLQEFLAGLAEHVRNLLVATTMKDGSLIEAGEATRARYLEAGADFSETVLLRLLMVADDTERTISSSSHPRLTLETALAKMASMADAVSIKDALDQLARLEKLVRLGKMAPAPLVLPPKASAPPPPEEPPPPPPRRESHRTDAEPPPSSAAPAPGRPASTGGFTSTNLFGRPALILPETGAEPSALLDVAVAAPSGIDGWVDVWPTVVRTLMERKVQVGMMLEHSRPLEVSAGELLIAVPSEFHARMLDSAGSDLMEHVHLVAHEPVDRLRFTVRRDLVPVPKDPATMDPREYMRRQRRESPVIKAIFEQFGGEIVW